MKTLEERLRELRVDAEHGRYTEEEKGKRRCYNNGIDVALAIVADAPRIYRGEEILDAPCGVYVFRQQGDPRWIGLCGNTYQYYSGMEFFGPLPTNSPSEGKG